MSEMYTAVVGTENVKVRIDAAWNELVVEDNDDRCVIRLNAEIADSIIDALNGWKQEQLAKKNEVTA